MVDPDYYDNGLLTGTAPPFKGKGAYFYYMLLDANGEALNQTLDEAFGPFKNTSVSAAKNEVLLAVGHIPRLLTGATTSSNEEEAESGDPEQGEAESDPEPAGYTTESSASLFVQIEGTIAGKRINYGDFSFYSPFMAVDNPISIVNGREIYGLNKGLGEFEFTPRKKSRAGGDQASQKKYQDAELINVSAFGLSEYGNDKMVEMAPLLTVEFPRNAEGQLSSCDREEMDQLFKELHYDEQYSAEVLDHWRLLSYKWCVEPVIWQYQVRQFRSPGNGSSADTKQIVKSSIQVPRRNGQRWWYESNYPTTRINRVDSHRIGPLLGLTECEADDESCEPIQGRLVWGVHADFDMPEGKVIATLPAEKAKPTKSG